MKNRVRVTTPEYVSLELHTAGIGSRGVSLLIDWIVLGILMLFFALFFLLFSLLAESMGTPFWTSVIRGVSLVVILFMPLCYFTLAETFLSGRTIGKMAVGLRVVTDQGTVPSFATILLRNILRIVDAMPIFYLIGLTTVVLQKHEKRLGDLAAGTLVIHDEKTTQPSITLLHSQTEKLIQSKTMTTLTVEHWTWIARFLSRRQELLKERRQQLAEKMVTQLFPNSPIEKGQEEAALEAAYLYLSADDNHHQMSS
ncbi:Uncharacterized membrane protein YckC, RDD family [Marininema mesophilum]|uniref:Uncharacterized membrane protein YckC, RDD family n=1 Tax=Marininema mesophilum TaxID=1048340 RepID=A0A1H2ZMN0_9BACL|nr:RDD family protein [Marininema mesophilum]SDX18680.1 Uncharacterized membrane protein YckC, RDD family [Marininema mesophilum]